MQQTEIQRKRPGGEKGEGGRTVFAKTFKGDFSWPSISHTAKYQFKILRKNRKINNFK